MSHSFTSPPMRSDSHITDTLAVRRIFEGMPADFLVRSMEERDYGIDLQLERFKGTKPTGQMALVQVKGKKAAFSKKKISLKFPVKTIEYARLFNTPFFVFYTSIKDSTTYFIWLQRYVNAVLDTQNSAWRGNGTVTIHFPTCNKLDETGWAKLTEYVSSQQLQREALEVLKIESELRLFGHLALGSEKYNRQSCILAVKRLPTLEHFFLGDRTGFNKENLDKFSLDLDQAFRNAEGLTKSERKSAKLLLSSLLESLEMPIREFLSTDTTDQSAYRSGDNPY